MNWRDYIHSDPEILGGKPVFKGTRIKVELLLELVGAGWDEKRIIDEYTGILPEHFRAAAAFAAEFLADETYVAVAQAKAA